MAEAIDTKIIGKPNRSDVSEESWPEWSFVFSEHVALWKPEIHNLMVEAVKSEAPLVMSDMSDAAKKSSMLLYSLLTQLLVGTSLRRLMKIQGRSGLEVWRLMKQKFEPNNESRMMGGDFSRSFPKPGMGMVTSMLSSKLGAS